MNPVPACAFLGLGSNVGNRCRNLNKAMDLLSRRVVIVKKSSVYETEPLDNIDQPRFLNMVCEVKTTLSPQGLLDFVKSIEKELGRLPGYTRNSPRTLDIDILFYEDMVVREPELSIPHPRLSSRAFVLVPMSEIAPDFVDPATGNSIGQLLAGVFDNRQGVSKAGEL